MNDHFNCLPQLGYEQQALGGLSPLQAEQIAGLQNQQVPIYPLFGQLESNASFIRRLEPWTQRDTRRDVYYRAKRLMRWLRLIKWCLQF